MSLRLRLTLWYSALLAGLLFLIVVMSLSSLDNRVRDEIDMEIKNKGDQIVSLLEITAPSSPIADFLLPTLGASFETEVFVQVRDANRRITHRSDNLINTTLPLPEALYRQALNGQAGFYALSSQQPDDLRVYFAPVTFGGEVIAIVQVARLLAPEQAILRELATSFFWIIAAALIVGAVVGYWLAGAALGPIQEATSTALAITRTGRLDRRIPVPDHRADEISTLINTFNEMLDRLQELFEKQKRFSGDISHELRTPLTTILGNISLLKRADTLPANEKQEMLAETEVEAQRMRRLISDLLLLAQEDTDMVMPRKRVELDTLMLNVYRQIKRHAAHIEINIVHEDQAVVMGDADRLRQLLVNLLNNAVQYTPAGGKIELGLQCLGEQAQITISDTGQGIATEDLPHIFDRFYRADKARTHGGTGLGLSIVRWVVDAHHGEIDVESTPGNGTTFHVRLPLAQGCDTASQPCP
ncbi:MAG: HAMP domain-containing protein [Chloroflexi bacterium]|nr:HAMP domain-containing protein [Chloroflexota bacterium]